MKKLTALLLGGLMATTKAGFISRYLTEDEIYQMQEGRTLSMFCPVKPERLKMVEVSYVDFAKHPHYDGQLVVLDAVASQVMQIFKELYERQFPLQQIQPMHIYEGNDAAAMAANNTSCFNDRPITGDASQLSLHAYGVAIDINPMQNPYISFTSSTGQAQYLPKDAVTYANRLQERPGKPTRLGMAEAVIDIFAQNGFRIWGGHWDSPIDYQHFQIPHAVATLLAAMPAKDAIAFFADYARDEAFEGRLKKCLGKEDLLTAYNKGAEAFRTVWQQSALGSQLT